MGKSINRLLANIFVVLGICLLIASGIFISDKLPFPSITAIFPCIGAAIIILAARDSPIGRLAFGNPVFIKIGVLSYAIYLVHWPIIVFYRYLTTSPPTVAAYIVYFVVIGCLAYLLHKTVEIPMRRIKYFEGFTGKRVTVSAMALLFFIIPLCFLIFSQFSGARQPTTLDNLIRVTNNADGKITHRHPTCSFTDFSSFDPANCTNPVNNKINILVLGDSVAHRLWSGLCAFA